MLRSGAGLPGATVLHEDAIYPAKAAGIPIHICNTMDPQAPGTWIVAQATEPAGAITGLAGRRGYSALQVEKERSNSEVGYCRKILSCLEKNGVPFEHLATGIGSVCLVAQTELLEPHRQQLLSDVEAAVHPDSLQICHGLSMIAVVGRGHGRAASGGLPALYRRQPGWGQLIRLIDQGTKELNIVLGVDDGDYEQAMQAILTAFSQKIKEEQNIWNTKSLETP